MSCVGSVVLRLICIGSLAFWISVYFRLLFGLCQLRISLHLFWAKSVCLSSVHRGCGRFVLVLCHFQVYVSFMSSLCEVSVRFVSCCQVYAKLLLRFGLVFVRFVLALCYFVRFGSSSFWVFVHFMSSCQVYVRCLSGLCWVSVEVMSFCQVYVRFLFGFC